MEMGILGYLQRQLSRQPSSSDLYLEDLFGAASAAIGK